MIWVIIIIVAVLALIALVLVFLYNKLVRLRNRTQNAWAQVNVQLRRRYDLIPNLVESVKGYAAHERGTFDEVTKAQEERVSTLTAAEVRLLPFLATHLSFREIGEHLYVSRNTVKTQAISVYRKLGVSSRSKAIERAVELGLVDLAPVVTGISSARDDAVTTG